MSSNGEGLQFRSEKRAAGPLHPGEGITLLAISGLLFWGGAVLLKGRPIWLIAGPLPIVSFALPAFAWAAARGALPQVFPSARVRPSALLAALALAVGGSLVALSLAGVLSGFKGASREEAELRRFLLQFSPGLRLLLFGLVPAFCEEIMFRGAFLGSLRRWNAIPACVTSGVVFALFHGSVIRFLPVAILGTVLALIVWRTNNLWLSMAGHALHNTAILAVLSMGGGGGTASPALIAAMGTVGAALLAGGLVVPIGPPGGGGPDDEGPVEPGNDGRGAVIQESGDRGTE